MGLILRLPVEEGLGGRARVKYARLCGPVRLKNDNKPDGRDLRR